MCKHQMLLHDLPEAIQRAVVCRAKRVEHAAGTTLFQASTAEHCSFIASGSVALLCGLAGEAWREACSLGPGDILALPLLLGVQPAYSAVAITPVKVLQIHPTALASVEYRSPHLHKLLRRHAAEQLNRALSVAACNARHDLNQRVARWLLTIDNHNPGEAIGVTHTTLAMLLGVRRASVTVTLHFLEGMGAIRARRGSIIVRDRLRLLELSCRCYRPVASPPARRAQGNSASARRRTSRSAA